MKERKQIEIELLKKRYGIVEYGPDQDWVLFKEFILPPGWNREKTELLIIISPGYPVTPPDNFYVPVGLKLASGIAPNNYSEGPQHLGKQWGQFSFHAQQGTWRPSPELFDGDNLLTFMLQVEKRLRELN